MRFHVKVSAALTAFVLLLPASPAAGRADSDAFQFGGVCFRLADADRAGIAKELRLRAKIAPAQIVGLTLKLRGEEDILRRAEEKSFARWRASYPLTRQQVDAAIITTFNGLRFVRVHVEAVWRRSDGRGFRFDDVIGAPQCPTDGS